MRLLRYTLRLSISAKLSRNGISVGIIKNYTLLIGVVIVVEPKDNVDLILNLIVTIPLVVLSIKIEVSLR